VNVKAVALTGCMLTRSSIATAKMQISNFLDLNIKQFYFSVIDNYYELEI